MNTLILYYSYTGHCKAFAEKLAKKKGADIEEVETTKSLAKVAAYVQGSFAAIRQKPVAINPIRKELRRYDSFILIAPVWANNPAPALYSIIGSLPLGKTIEVYMLSGSGRSNKEKLKTYIKNKGLSLTKYTDIKEGATP